MERIKSHSPEWENFELTPAHIKRLLNAYIDLHVEQFTKINKNGKVIHADIHPGNIFINLEALKSGKGKLFTLIDTGNTIQVSKEQTKAALRLTKFIQNGNTKDLSNIVLDGAILPEGLTKEQALQKIEGDLKKFFFDNETKIETMTVDKFYELSDNLLRKYKIISNNTQLNLNKAKKSANNSFKDLTNSFFSKKFGDKVNEDSLSETEAFTLAIKAGADYTKIKAKKLQLEKFQETKNLIQMSSKEALSFLKNKNMLKTNSEDYLTFEMKQQIKPDKKSFADF
jgi:predicted unusual protein kinase regulating ubiquinone biosynthesis (AarF/ABC1/UbiB family)